jgi:hypothetical protein
MQWIIIGITLYIFYYTIRFAILVWKEKNKLGAVFVGLLAFVVLLLAMLENSEGIM